MSKEKKEKELPPNEVVLEQEAAAAEENAAESPQAEEPQKDELEELTRQNSELNDKLLRHYAEFDNYKRRTTKEKEELSGYAKGLCIKQLLEVLDNFERALATECSDAEFRKGVDMIFHQFLDRLHAMGVTEIEAEGKPFDPELHNAVSQVEDDSFGENIVSQVLQKGYSLEGKVLRHAMVVVANP